VPDDATDRLAVLIDADNTSATHAAAILQELARYGIPTVKRAYGDWTTQHLVRWKDELPRLAIQPIQQFANTVGKSSTDSALIIDAMDLLYSGSLDAFAIVSSDSDFTRLATRLRESGKTVYGLGRRRTPESLQAACDRFIFLEVLESPGVVARDESAATEEAPPLPTLRPILEAAIEAASQEDGWAPLGPVGNYLSKTHTSFDPRNYGFAKLSALARAQDYLEVEQQEGRTPRVRLRPAPPPAKTAAAAGRRPARKTQKTQKTQKAQKAQKA
jgi:uncharacterized protein (TIGR00288 family)